MTKLEIYQLFKVLGVALVAAFAIFTTGWFSKKVNKLVKSATEWAGLLSIAIFIAMVVLIVVNANSPEVKKASNIDDLHNSTIYSIVFYALTYFARTIAFALIIGAFYFLLRRSLAYPKSTLFVIHKALLIIGAVLVVLLYVQDILKTVEDVEYAKVISFGQYVSIFVGGIFWMFVCSIIAAIGLPEAEKK